MQHIVCFGVLPRLETHPFIIVIIIFCNNRLRSFKLCLTLIAVVFM